MSNIKLISKFENAVRDNVNDLPTSIPTGGGADSWYLFKKNVPTNKLPNGEPNIVHMHDQYGNDTNVTRWADDYHLYTITPF